ncbi:hypothetical protein E1O_18740 [Burkholderiales bacterium GJ-E10]|nr:hypothetical protein E1O_18740 [Burkholderiales bacterium GJ-E10]
MGAVVDQATTIPPAASCGRNGATSIPARAGIGLRFPHHRDVLEARPDVAWFEVHSENYLGGGPTPATLDRVRRDYPISLHGVALSLGSAEGLSEAHLARLRDAIGRFEPGLVSEHLSWNVVDHTYLADLLPLPMTEEALAVVVRNVDHAQTALGRRILVENPSSYLRYRHSPIPEWEFLVEVAQRTGCGILCDVNNLYVSASNHGWSTRDYLAALPPETVGEIHLAGHALRDFGGGRVLRIDNHGSRVCAEVWDLYAEALHRFGPVPTLIEWDTDIPPLATLIDEAQLADAVLTRNGHERAAVAA